jgi:hypothetical protein
LGERISVENAAGRCSYRVDKAEKGGQRPESDDAELITVVPEAEGSSLDLRFKYDAGVEIV